jgi:hypothetical protein
MNDHLVAPAPSSASRIGSVLAPPEGATKVKVPAAKGVAYNFMVVERGMVWRTLPDGSMK